jgi:enoyl-CoA hydratase
MLKTEIRDRVAVVTLDDAKRRNAMSLDMARAITAERRRLEADAEVGALVFTGAAPAFSAGANLGELERATLDSLKPIYECFVGIGDSPLPTVAAVNGPAVGAGLNLALACDLRIAGRSARFESRFLDLALHPGGGHCWMLERMLGSQFASAMVLFGESIDGDEAARRGLAWRTVEDDELVDEAVRLAARAASVPSELVERMKVALQGAGNVLDHAAAVELEAQAQIWSIGQPEFRERLAAMKRRIAAHRRRKDGS